MFRFQWDQGAFLTHDHDRIVRLFQNLQSTDAVLASRCQCPVSLISVAADESKEAEARRHVENAKVMLSGLGIEVQDTLTPVGDAVKEIVEGSALI